MLLIMIKGGFEVGDTSDNPGNTVVERSIALGEPVVYVSANYRINGNCVCKTVKAADMMPLTLHAHSLWFLAWKGCSGCWHCERWHQRS